MTIMTCYQRASAFTFRYNLIMIIVTQKARRKKERKKERQTERKKERKSETEETTFQMCLRL